MKLKIAILVILTGVCFASQIETFTITSSAGENGWIEPNGITVRERGENQVFIATPADSYVVDKWFLDGTEVEVDEMQKIIYFISNIDSDHTVRVTFKKLELTQ